MLNPYLSIANKAMDQMRRFLIEFGMTPSSRARVTTVPEDTGSPLEQLRNRLRSIKGGKS